MIIGTGGLAHRFMDFFNSSKYTIFVGDVNDSSLSDINLFTKERELIKRLISEQPKKIFILISTSSQGNSPYVLHKRGMEEIIEKNCTDFFIFRVPIFIGIQNTESNLINFYINKILKNEHFQLYKNAKNYVIDVDNVYRIIDYIIKNDPKNKIYNLTAGVKLSALEILNYVEEFLGKKASYDIVEKGDDFVFNDESTFKIRAKLGINENSDHLPNLLNKYYSNIGINRSKKLISIIVPTYNEENGIFEFYKRTKNVLDSISTRFDHEIIFINDYSRDKTLEKLRAIEKLDNSVKVLNFSKNFGNQIAIMAGIDSALGDIAIIIDDDLQDPPELIVNFISEWDRGYKVVYGVRPNREGVNFLFKLIAKLYYKAINYLSDIDIPKDTGDFRLIDKDVLAVLRGIKEDDLYYRGLIAWVGFPQIGVEYIRDKRYAGVSTFNFSKYFRFAINGLISSSDKPLYLSSILGLTATFFSLLLSIIFIIQKIYTPNYTLQGWTSLSVMVLFFGGVQLLSIGILGIYISKIYRQVKNRPLYIINK